MHSGAMAYEWTARVQSEYDKLAAAPGFQQPPEIDGTKHERLPAALHALAFSSMHNAGYWFFFAGGTGLTGAVMLFLAYRVQRQHRHGLQS